MNLIDIPFIILAKSFLMLFTRECYKSSICVSSTWRFHREAKQLTGLEKCQCRLARIVRNHIGAAFLVWVHLMRKAYETGQTLYQVKHGMLSEYLRQQLKSPMLKIKAA